MTVHTIPFTSDSAMNARLKAKAKHSQPNPRAVWRLHNIAAIRCDRKRRECLWGPGYSRGVEV